MADGGREAAGGRDGSPADEERSIGPEAYWRRNLRYVAVLLSIWALVSYGAGILFVDELNRIRIPGTGFPLGFWFAQQGSIYVFVVLIFTYVWLMNRLDRKADVDEPGRTPPRHRARGRSRGRRQRPARPGDASE